MRISQISFLLVALFFLTACGSKKDILYFQDINEIPAAAYVYDQANYQIRIMPSDNLLITVSALNPEHVDVFNTIQLNRGSSANLELQGHLVDENGDINFPGIGKLHVAGLTKQEAIDMIQNKISVLVKNTTVNIRFLNYRISVLGEVNRPGVHHVSEERISILEALAMAGDMTIYGNRHDVILCRVENGEKKFHHIDMTSSALFFSENYYLQQNDILYVKQNSAKVRSSTNFNSNMSIVSIAVSLVSLTLTVLTFINSK